LGVLENTSSLKIKDTWRRTNRLKLEDQRYLEENKQVEA
jgi:hypothetical protein